MNLITFTFQSGEDEQPELVQAIEAFRNAVTDQDVTVSLFRDTTDLNRFFQIILTEKSVEEVTEIIQTHPLAKTVFERIKDSESRIVVSCLEQVL
jgi:hypothetical protein